MGNVVTGWFRRTRAWASAHPLALDIIIAAFIGGLAIWGHYGTSIEGSEQPHDLFGLSLVIGQAAAFVFRRRKPIISLLVICALTIVFWIQDYATSFDPFSLLAAYNATAHSGPNRRRVWMVVSAAVATLAGIALAGVLAPSEDLPPAAIVGITVVHLTAAVAGELVYQRRNRLEQLEERAERAERERTLLARQAVLDERAHIARDLHDVVAHGMSLMIVQANAAERIIDTDPEGATTALRHIQTAGRDALGEMRRMLSLLRDEQLDEATLRPQPTLDDLGRAVQHTIDAGVPTTLHVEGGPALRAAGEEMAAYRVVQEALTNVVKHAGPRARASVTVAYADDSIAVEVSDTGVGADAETIARSTGHGFVGMRERVDLYGGTLTTGLRPGGGFRIAATFPVPPVDGSARADAAANAEVDA